MRAKVIATGEIKEIKEVKLEDRYILPDCIEIVNEIDWEQRRFELVKSLISEMIIIRDWTPSDFASTCVEFANAIIEKLKE